MSDFTDDELQTLGQIVWNAMAAWDTKQRNERSELRSNQYAADAGVHAYYAPIIDRHARLHEKIMGLLNTPAPDPTAPVAP